MSCDSTAVVRPVFIVAVLGFIASPALAKVPKQALDIVVVEVMLGKPKFPAAIIAIVKQAAIDEQTWYRHSGRAVAMRVGIEQLSTKTAGAAVAAMLLPFATNENAIAARIKFIDCATGAEVGSFKAQASDILDGGLSFGDVGQFAADTALGLIPIPFLGDILSIGMEAGASAGVKRDVVVDAMGRNLMTVTFASLYGSTAAKAVVKQRKSVSKLARAKGTPMPRTAPDAGSTAPQLDATMPSICPAGTAVPIVATAAAITPASLGEPRH